MGASKRGHRWTWPVRVVGAVGGPPPRRYHRFTVASTSSDGARRAQHTGPVHGRRCVHLRFLCMCTPLRIPYDSY